jgi:Ca-activated chloride channel family protein
MSTDINDPKLTAYILGELSDDQRATVEQDLAADSALRAEIDALRGVATRLQSELAAETVLAPTIAAPIPSAARPSVTTPSPNGRAAVRRFAIAASLLAAAGLASYAAPRWNRSEQTLSQYVWTDNAGYEPSSATKPSEKSPDSTLHVWFKPDAKKASQRPPAETPTSSPKYDVTIAGNKGRLEKFLEVGKGEIPRGDAQPALDQPKSSRESEGDRIGGRQGQPAGDQPGNPANTKHSSPSGPGAPPQAATEGGGKQGGGEHSAQASRETTAAESIVPANVSGQEAQAKYYKLTEEVRKRSEGYRLATAPGTRVEGRGEFEHKKSLFDNLAEGETASHPSSSFTTVVPQTAPGTESYAPIAEQSFTAIRDKQSALSTFSIDVDTASYSNVRRFLENGKLPPANSVRIEEMVNYFTYDYPQPEGDAPFSVNLEVAACPWQPEHRLVRVGLKGREIPRDKRPPSNLVFLLDVSGSMQPENKLPLVKQSMKLLVEQLNENDRVAIVTYAGEAGLKLSSTTAAEKETIHAAIDSLYAGGSTNGEGGLRLAYEIAVASKIAGGTNRVILATDGDFNVGLASDADMETLITEKAATGVFLTAIGVGMGNLKDSKLERLADKGNGNYAYIDKPSEAHKVFVEQLAGTLCTIAKDVKIQVEFNPATVRAHRLVGYENRLLAHKDFNDDRKDAGEIGAGHAVTALYEIVPATGAQVVAASGVDRSRYQVEEPAVPLTGAAKSGELMVVKLRYKQPEGTESKLIETTVAKSDKRFYEASADFKFAAAVATFAMRLRDSQHRATENRGTATFALALELAQSALARDESGRRREFVDLVTKAKQLAGER